MSIRETLQNRPWLGWTFAGAMLLVAIFLLFRPAGAGNPYAFDRLTQDITIKDRETGEEWTIKRGRMEQILWDRGGKLDSNVGLPNPKTGTLTGFPKSDWETTVERIKQDRQAAIDAYGGHVPSTPTTRRASAPK
jgi:hypothetical protein